MKFSKLHFHKTFKIILLNRFNSNKFSVKEKVKEIGYQTYQKILVGECKKMKSKIDFGLKL